jgi:UDP-glucose:(heptosyl)LPS alpha-1,3-glucosyltransferase
MNIGIVVGRYRMEGGIERAAVELSRSLAGQGHAITICTSSMTTPPPERSALIHIPTWNLSTSTRYATFRISSRLKLASSKFDIIHAHGTDMARGDVITAQSCHLSGLEVRKKYFGEFAPSRNFHIADALILRGERTAYRKGSFTKIIAVSTLVKEDLVHYYRAQEDDIAVVPNGVNTGEFHPERRRALRQAMRSHYGFTDEEVVLLFVGNEFGRKGLQTIISSMALLKNKRLRLLVCGHDRPDRFMTLAGGLGLADKITFTGLARDVMRYYAAADIFVFPTLQEAFGMVITEAMASGLPVIVSRNAGAARDFIEDGKDGLTLSDPLNAGELADKISFLAGHETLRHAIGNEAHRKVQTSDWETVARAVTAIYRGLL